MDRTTASRTTSSRAGSRTAASRIDERDGESRRTRPTRAPHSTAVRSTDRALVCSGCGGPGRTRDEAADLAVDWLVVDTNTDATTGPAYTGRFHHACRPAGIPGELTCAGCGDGPLLDPTLTAVLTGIGGVVDLFTAAALTAWLDDHGWTGDPHPATGPVAELEDSYSDFEAGEGPRCPACSPRPARTRRSAAAGTAR